MPHKTKNRNKKFTPPEIFNDGKVRHPRPLGLTMLNLNTLTQPNLKQNLIERIINLYVNEGMQWMGKHRTINEMSIYLNIKPEQLLKLMNKDLERLMGFFEGREGLGLARVSIQNALKKGLEIMALHHDQVRMLLGQQGNEYVPFLTGETNRALANLAGAMKPYLETIKLMTDKMTTNPFVPSDGSSMSGGVKYMSASEAIALLNQSGDSMYTNHELIAAKEQTMLGLPDVNARNQDLSSIGVRKSVHHSPIEVKETLPKRHEIHHERGKDDMPNPDDFVA